MANSEERRNPSSPLSDGHADCSSRYSVSGEASPLLGSTGNIRSYKRRWYVLLVFSFAALLQSAVWNCFGPIAQSAEAVFGWSDAEIGKLNNWGNILSMVFMVPAAWLLDVKGLRPLMLSCAVLMVLATSLRCITSEPVSATWLINIAAILNGLAGTVTFAGPALLSATWFPPHQRATATAVSTAFSLMGTTGGFIIGPLLVPQPDRRMSVTDIRPLHCTSDVADEQPNITNTIDVAAERDGLMLLMYVECAACVLLLLMVVVYFPSKPPSPPSLTASMDRTSFLQGLKGLFIHKRFLLILMAYGVSTGVFTAFGAVLDVNLDHIDVSQNQAGWMGFYATMGGCVSGLLISRVSDKFMRHMKMLLLLMFFLATSATVWFVLIRLSYVSFSITSLYISFTLIGVFIPGSVPLFYELGCEASYPTAEGVTTGVLTLFDNLIGSIFLSIPPTPAIGPLLVPQPDRRMNVTDIRPLNGTSDVADEQPNITNAIDVAAERDGLMLLMYAECAACVLLLLLVVVYFPSKPPSPPSLTASMDRTSFLQGLKGLFIHKRFLLILVAYGVPTGVFTAFGAVLDVNLDHIDVSQNQAGWMGFYATMGGCVSGLLISRVSDKFMRHMKMLLLLMFFLATSATAWFVLIPLSYVSFSITSLYISFTLIGVFVPGSVPLFYELGCEASYPTAEGVTTGVLTLFDNLIGSIFLSILPTPAIGVRWMNWCLLGAVVFSIPLLVLFKEGYTRTNIDMEKSFPS